MQQQKAIENYILQEIIYQGSQSTVYKGYNLLKNDLVVIKEISRQLILEYDNLDECIKNEIEVLTNISNPYIVEFIEMLKTDNNIYFIYEYSDFGFCKRLDRLSDRTDTLVGTPNYTAPEILLGKQYSMKVDIWSLGCVLYVMLFGKKLYDDGDIAKLIKIQEIQNIQIPSDIYVSEQTINLLKRMVEKDENKRIGWQDLFDLILTKEDIEKLNQHQLKYSIDEIMSPEKNSIVQNLNIQTISGLKGLNFDIYEFKNTFIYESFSSLIVKEYNHSKRLVQTMKEDFQNEVQKNNIQ
ncbi:protein kinase domain protein [Ichthyophthirius multifiliis]|uniref:Protein kinase domain protein n=1 Tax=Ichthyophthirius multifiliis TaxID=5932 RepID=G0QLD1_ICHMU|nr:protein kinase domain protein [Ichthyophthirius multifiliis]EGR33977.1 protein kinase domain protein [Ichthyophthirius multifiliis]|eukprot:XP_004039281.1 protein kinase domain protein [Ichthyophthirius multifiliis]